MEQESNMTSDVQTVDQTGGDAPAEYMNTVAQQGQSTPEVKLFDKGDARTLALPDRHASQEEWQSFYRQLGTPSAAEDYYLPLPEGDSGEFAKAIAPVLHNANITQEQASALAQGWNELQNQQMQVYQEQMRQQEAAAYARNQAEARQLEQEWQGHYDANIEFARRAKTQFLPAEKADAIVDALEGAIGMKATMQMLANIGKGLAEDSAAGLGRSNTASPKDAASILFGRG